MKTIGQVMNTPATSNVDLVSNASGEASAQYARDIALAEIADTLEDIAVLLAHIALALIKEDDAPAT